MDEKRTSILRMCGGAFEEIADREMGRIVENMMDPNCKADAARKLTITLNIKPDSYRERFAVSYQVKTQLVPVDPAVTMLCLSSDPGTGEAALVEMTYQVPGQQMLDGGEAGAPKILKFELPNTAEL